MSLNKNFKELALAIDAPREDIKKRANEITKFIKKKLSGKPEFHYIGSYAIHTSIKEKENAYDVDVAIISKDLLGEEVLALKSELYNILRDYRERINDDPKVKWQTYAITIDFQSSSSKKNYHFDYTIYNDKREVVKGKQHEELFFEKSGNLDIKTKYRELKEDSKLVFREIVKLLKHWNKNGYKSANTKSIPSVSFVGFVYEYIKNDWDGTDDYIEMMEEITEEMVNEYPDWGIFVEPFDNVLIRNTETQNDGIKSRLEEFHEDLLIASTENETDAFSRLEKYFKGLKKPKGETNNGKRAEIVRTTESQGA